MPSPATKKRKVAAVTASNGPTHGSNGLQSDYTASEALLEAIEDADVTHLFVNLGSDHPAIMEALSKRQKSGKEKLRVITAPNEFVGLCATQGFFQATGKMQAIIVHVDAGTLAMAGAIHNAARARIPVLMVAGTSPVTDEHEMVGGRNEFIHYLQDTIDQRGIVRGYTRFDNEIRTGKNVKQCVMRAAQFARSEPQGPTYLMASREVLEEKIDPYALNKTKWNPLAPSGLAPESVKTIGNALVAAKQPVIVTTYLGRDAKAVPELVALAEKLGIAVIEALPAYLNFPHDHDLYVGNHWSEGLKDSPLETADVVLVIDCDVPWVKGTFKPTDSAKIYHIDCDPLKIQMSLFHVPAELATQANARTALEQLNNYLDTYLTGVEMSALTTDISNRKEAVKRSHDAYVQGFTSLTAQPTDSNVLTPHYVLSRLREHLPPTAIICSEGISNYRPIADVMACTLPGSYFTSGATALGWHGGAALGVKLAHPDRDVVAITGDGSFLFSIPSTVHWMSRKYNAPFLTVIMNNRGWKSPMLSASAMRAQRESKYAMQTTADDLYVTFDPPPDHSAVAVAAGAGWGTTVKKVDEVDKAIERALKTIREEGRSAMLDIWLPKFKTGDRVG